MNARSGSHAVATPGALLRLPDSTVCRCSATDVDSGSSAFKTAFTNEFSIGGISRVGKRDPGLVGGGNGGSGTSVNYDDGNLNYDRGLASFAVQGKSKLAGSSERLELAVEVVYFYDFVNADGDTEFHDLSEQARDLAGRGIYLNDTFVGIKENIGDAWLNLRLGLQRLRWSDSPWFGQSIAPVNPISASRRYQPGNSPTDAVVAVPMLFGQLVTSRKWTLSAFYQFGFHPTEPEAAGTFLSANDYYSPGSRYIQLGNGSPLVPDTDASVVTPVTPFGSRVPRSGDRRPSSYGQFGLRIETPEFGEARLAVGGYAMRVHAREPIVSVHTGTLGGLLGDTAPDYTSSGSYFLEYPEHVNITGLSARMRPASFTQFNLNYSMRFDQPLQIDDEILITAGLAPAAAVGACTPNPANAVCTGTLAALNRNPLIAERGGISATNAGSFFDTELSGYERFDVSQWAISALQGLPPVLGATQWYASAEAGGLTIHGFKPGFLDASTTVRPDATGAPRNGLATRSAWGYRLYTRIEFANIAGLRSVAPSLTWIHDVAGNAPITLGTLLEGNKSYVLAIESDIDRSLSARLSYRAWLGKGNNADRYTDRDFVAFSLTRKF